MQNKKYFCAFLDDVEVSLIEGLIRRVTTEGESYYIKYALWNESSKRLDELIPVDFSELSTILDMERKKSGMLNNLTVFKNSDTCRIASVEFYDLEILLFMDKKIKEKIEAKYDMEFMPEKEFMKILGSN